MPIDIFPYHRQDDETMCGPACGQMVLRHLNLSSTQISLPEQVLLKQDAGKLPSATTLPWKNYVGDAWATKPDGLKYTLGLRQQPFKVAFDAFYNGRIKDGSGQKGYLTWLRNWIKKTTYPIVPVHGTFFYKQQLSSIVEAKGYSNLVNYDAKSDYDAHWIVLFKHDLNGFVGNDPYFPLTTGAAIHSHGDSCKTVLIHINGSDTAIGDYNFPVINRTAIAWIKLPSVGPVPPGDPSGRIGWRPPVEEAPIQPPVLPPPPLPMVVYDASNRPFDRTSVWDQMNSFGLFTTPPCNAYLSGTTFGTPRLVRRLDVHGRDYYLVPMLKSDGNSSAMVRVDAPTGTYLDSLYYSENPFIFDKSQRQQIRTKEEIAKMNKHWRDPYSKQINELATEMVWLPCRESRSAFFPFYVIKPPALGPVAVPRFFVRVDWRVFPKLTY